MSLTENFKFHIVAMLQLADFTPAKAYTHHDLLLQYQTILNNWNHRSTAFFLENYIHPAAIRSLYIRASLGEHATFTSSVIPHCQNTLSAESQKILYKTCAL